MSFELWALAILGGTLASSIYLNYRLLKHISGTEEYKNYIDEEKFEETIKEFVDESEPVKLDDEEEYNRDLILKKRGY